MSLFSPRTTVIHPDFSDLEGFVRSVPERFEKGEGRVIHKGRNELRILEHEGRCFVVKAFHPPHIINRFVYGILRPSKAKRSFDNALRLLSIGVGTPQPIGYVNIRRGWLFDRSYYISLQSACSHVYQELFEHPFACEEEVMRAIGKTTARLHSNKLAHKDYGRGNILFEEKNGKVSIELVDLNRMTEGPLDMDAGCKNLERLPCTPGMHRALAESYAAERGFDAEECFRLMQKYRSVQPGKIDDKY